MSPRTQVHLFEPEMRGLLLLSKLGE